MSLIHERFLAHPLCSELLLRASEYIKRRQSALTVPELLQPWGQSTERVSDAEFDEFMHLATAPGDGADLLWECVNASAATQRAKAVAAAQGYGLRIEGFSLRQAYDPEAPCQELRLHLTLTDSGIAVRRQLGEEGEPA